MEILTIQRRLVEVGRIRLGEKKTSQNGSKYPARLQRFRLTSRDKERLDQAAALYGGTVREWEGQFELYTDTNVLPVAVVPGQAVSQAFELWGQKPLPGGKKTAVICLRRCDGETEYVSDRACLCSEADEQVCKPTTRLSVVLTEVPGIGVWRVEAHGWNAATELIGSVRLLESLVATGRPVRARLRLDFRQQATETETRQFVVPVLDIDHTLGQVLDTIGSAPRPALTPVPVADLPEAPNSSTAAQIASVTSPAPKPLRRNSAEPLPATGLAPGAPTCARCGGSLLPPAVPAIVNGERVHKDGCPSTRTDGQLEGGENASPPDLEPSAAPNSKAFFAECGKAFTAAREAAPAREKTKTVDRLRYALTWAQTGGRTIHSSDLTVEELAACTERAHDIVTGAMTYEMVDTGVVFTINDRELVVEWSAIEAA